MKKLIILSLLFSFNIFSADFTKDITRDYETIRAQKNFNSTSIKDRLKNTTVILLPGILSETAIDGSKQPINLSLLVGDYYRDYMTWLDRMGIKNKRIIVESEDTVEDNSLYIEKELNKIQGDLFIISHSKGGLEFLNIILRNKKIKKRTRAWIAMQSPFYGAKIADLFAETPIIKYGTKWVFSFFGGSIEGLTSVGLKERAVFHKKMDKKIVEELKGIKFIQYFTYIENQFGPETPLETTRDIISLQRGKNDGLVEIESAYLPVGEYIVEAQVDHLATVIDYKRLKLIPAITRNYKNWHFDRVAHLRSLLHLGL